MISYQEMELIMANHLVIGLGGTGGKVLRALRRDIFQESQNGDIPGVNLGYMYLDADPSLMDPDDPTWQTLGKSFQLAADSQVLISGANLHPYLEQVDKNPGDEGWFGDKQHWADMINADPETMTQGRMRRVGRLLLAANLGRFTEALDKQVNKLVGKSGYDNVTFHVCAGLGGTIGSGTLIDVISQIRTRYVALDAVQYRIILYLLLPEEQPAAHRDTANYHANAYAALMELNSLSVGAFFPHDLSKKNQKCAITYPFNSCYLFSDQNESGRKTDGDQELPNILADFLYQRIVMLKDIGWSSLDRMENFENNLAAPETAAGGDVPERSKRFLAVGLKRLIIPEEEIREFLAYCLARQSVLQMKYNNRTEELGFLNIPPVADFDEYVQRNDVQSKWKISDEHLCLSKGILLEDAADKKWKTIPAVWENVVANFVEVIEASKAENWIDELAKLCDKQFNEDFRGMGVKRFYQLKSVALADMVKVIVAGIESELFDQWKNSELSLHEVARLMASLIADTEDRLRQIEGKIARAKEKEDLCQAQISKKRQAFDRCGLMGKMVGKKWDLFHAQVELMQQKYVIMTLIEGFLFSKSLLLNLVAEFNRLNRAVATCTALLTEAVARCDLGMKERCKGSFEADIHGH
ncbi:MAG: hypothetical protein HQK60_08045, partial [Deltaproteobacteria bacterium]|nr:hypothetical protein [Deltaproteobacteria bacterium]